MVEYFFPAQNFKRLLAVSWGVLIYVPIKSLILAVPLKIKCNTLFKKIDTCKEVGADLLESCIKVVSV